MDGIDLKSTFGLTQKESNQLADIFKNKKNNKMSAKEKNDLLNKLSGNGIEKNEENIKNMKDMTEKEKIEYRNNLKKKMKMKQKQMKFSRTTKYNQNKLSSKLNTNEQLTKTMNDLIENEKKEDIDDYLM